MRDALLDAEVILCDETTFQVLKEKGRKPQTKSHLWSQMTGTGIPICCYTYTPGVAGRSWLTSCSEACRKALL